VDNYEKIKIFLQNIEIKYLILKKFPHQKFWWIFSKIAVNLWYP